MLRATSPTLATLPLLLPTAVGVSCAFCSQPDAHSQCELCNRVVYCNTECQSLDWTRHGLYCGENLVDNIHILDSAPDHVLEQLDSSTRFLRAWRQASARWACHAAELTIGVDNFLEKHAFLVLFHSRGDFSPHEPLRNFELTMAGFLGNEGLAKWIRVSQPVDNADIILREFTALSPSPTQLRIVMGTRRMWTIFAVDIAHGPHTTFEPSKARILGRLMANDFYAGAFKTAVEAGNLDRDAELLREYNSQPIATLKARLAL
ncbi:hypothetical protein HMN09_01060300 [Mycena chlorophos]|uniref:MYND-type domain-containing protein n=1 Tax=Mycena chlorophos TaxID=658473 RepID=A0A8H6VWG0_MYCCL|nr:hypothetical protein HMN09_01060300 [Mycena chlorophos]